MSSDLHYLLKQVGLTYNEAKVYLYLLQIGTKLGADIHTDLKMDKSSCYRALNNLTEKNLIYAVGEERNRQFTANPPDHIDALVQAEEQKLLQTKKSLAEFQKQIQKSNENNGRPNPNILAHPENNSFRTQLDSMKNDIQQIKSDIDNLKKSQKIDKLNL